MFKEQDVIIIYAINDNYKLDKRLFFRKGLQGYFDIIIVS